MDWDDGGRSWSDPVCLLHGPLRNISTAMLARDGELLWAMDYDLPDGMYAGGLHRTVPVGERPESSAER